MSGIKFDASSLLKGLTELDEKVAKASELYGNTAGTKMVNDAKKNAPWTDGPFKSRQSIDHEVISKGGQTEIRLRGNTPHFKYLEFCHEKKWAILWPTIQKHTAEVLKGWAKVIWK
ncbi:Uncharacterised protein [uncultured Clostridium sp.]|uniref:hypothetical protein n=1 Tax=uncultured Clostridium sp. TaxID=59620 RepID=UPI00082288A2|nr:hypothetical protein [uncultured Clostridium sp.]SCJ52093.1 Uncharacterised protein [uncultured Clostridium sp.]